MHLETGAHGADDQTSGPGHVLAGAINEPPRLADSFRSVAVLLTAYAAAMFLFFRPVIFSEFDLGFGDRADALIEISILEHWRHVLSGTAAWNATGYFYPYAGTIGYNDGYFLYGMIYSFWRWFADPFLAETLNIFTFKSIGFFATYALISRSLAWGRPLALLAALIWAISNNLTVQAGHPQLQSVALLPVVMMLMIGVIRAECEGRRWQGRALGIGLAALMAAWLMTSYYMAWFAIYFAAIGAFFWLLFSKYLAPRAFLRLLDRHIATLVVIVVAFEIFLIPFLFVYLPKFHETGGQNYLSAYFYLTRIIDPINVGPDNYLWGWIFRGMIAVARNVAPGDSGLADRVLLNEHIMGFPLIMFALTIIAAYRVVIRRRVGFDQPAPVELRALALAMIVSWGLTLYVGAYSPWKLVYALVPGAGGIRVVSRYQLILILPALLLMVATYRDQAARMLRSRPWLAAGLMTLLVAEQLNAAPPAGLSRSAQRRDLWTIPVPPAGCQAFYVVTARRNEPVYGRAELNSLYPHNVDAMFLAQRWHMPTINGFSTFNPPDWQFANPLAADYDTRVAIYATRHGIRGLCRLDMRQARPWRRMDESPNSPTR